MEILWNIGEEKLVIEIRSQDTSGCSNTRFRNDVSKLDEQEEREFDVDAMKYENFIANRSASLSIFTKDAAKARTYTFLVKERLNTDNNVEHTVTYVVTIRNCIPEWSGDDDGSRLVYMLFEKPTVLEMES